MTHRHFPETPRFERFAVTPSGRAIGADVHIDDLAAIDEATIRELKRAAVAYQVVRIRDQDLRSGEVVHFARQIGDPTVRGRETAERARRDNKLTDERFPENGAPQGAYGSQELYWHSDMVTMEKPASFTVLYAVEAPSGEGQTVFASTTLAAEALAADKLAELTKLSLKNSGAANAAGLVEGFDEITDVTTSPGRVHPLVSLHPETGRPALFLGRRMHAYLTGLPVAESERLLDEVWAHATQDAFQWEQDWRPGDMVLFDNRGLLHRRNPFSPERRRLLQQIVLRGTHPVIRYEPQPQAAHA
jgi:taurine dioxygenase